jgi:3-hydroxyisobutyrate dehydrogenase-like beta-hydroxyacid dehydrogenase
MARYFETRFFCQLRFEAHLKDADLIEKFCSSLQSPIPALGVVEKNLAAALALGLGTENASALIKALEKAGSS